MKCKAKEYPSWVCFDCGKKHGKFDVGICTVHYGTCGVCGEKKPVTEPRDFGHLRDSWETERGAK